MKINRDLLNTLPCKEHLEQIFSRAEEITFGKISSKQEGYIYKDWKLPRCTNVLKMDGSKCEPLMFWARKQVALRAEQELLHALSSHNITEEEVRIICNNAIQEPDKQLNDAADKGTIEHDNIERFLFKEKYEETDGLNRFKQAWDKFGGEVLATEVPIVWIDKKTGLGFGGRLDSLIWKDGLYIGDNKTSKTVHESYGCQLSAYKNAVEQMSEYNLNVLGGVIFHIPDLNVLNNKQRAEYEKRGSLVECKNLEAAFEHYRLLLGLYNCRNNKYF